MKKIIRIQNLIFPFMLSAFFISCYDEPLTKTPKNESNNLSITIEEHGKFHNEAILSVINNSKSNKTEETFGSVLNIMKNEMSKKYPEQFGNLDLNELRGILEFNLKLSNFQYNSEFYENLKSKVGEENIEEQMLQLMDKAFYEGTISEKDFSDISLKNKNLHAQLALFKSYYFASKELWTKKAGKDYIVGQYSKECDPTSQVIIADAIGGTLIGILTGGLGAPAGGGAVSLAVRTAQLEEYDGGCIE